MKTTVAPAATDRERGENVEKGHGLLRVVGRGGRRGLFVSSSSSFFFFLRCRLLLFSHFLFLQDFTNV